jgi:uncharacterized membrane protein SpoIIM required for sporulation
MLLLCVFLMPALNFLRKRFLAQIHHVHVVALLALAGYLILILTIVLDNGVRLGAVAALRLLD